MRLFVLVIAFSLTGCMSAVYYPNIVHAPMLAKQGEASLSVHGSPIQLQGSAAYAPIDHFAVRAQADGRVSFTGANEGNSSVDAGLGWFTAESKERGWRAGIAADAGIGRVRNVLSRADWETFNNPDGLEYTVTTFETEFTRVSSQLELGWKQDDYLLGGVVRVSRVEGKLHYESTENESAAEDVSWTLVEPIGILRMKMRYGLALEMQLGASIPHGGVGPVAEAGVLWPFVAAIGLVGDF